MSVSTNGTTVFKEQSRHVLRNNASRCLRRTTMVRNYVRRDVGQPDSRTAGIANKLTEAGVQTSYVHSRNKRKSIDGNYCGDHNVGRGGFYCERKSAPSCGGLRFWGLFTPTTPISISTTLKKVIHTHTSTRRHAVRSTRTQWRNSVPHTRDIPPPTSCVYIIHA